VFQQLLITTGQCSLNHGRPTVTYSSAFLVSRVVCCINLRYLLSGTSTLVAQWLVNRQLFVNTFSRVVQKLRILYANSIVTRVG